MSNGIFRTIHGVKFVKLGKRLIPIKKIRAITFSEASMFSSGGSVSVWSEGYDNSFTFSEGDEVYTTFHAIHNASPVFPNNPNNRTDERNVVNASTNSGPAVPKYDSTIKKKN